MPGDDAGARRLAVVELPGGERVQLEEGRVRVDEPVDPLARGELAARAVALDRLLAAAARDLRRALAQLGDERRHPLAPARELVGAALDLRREDGHGRSLSRPPDAWISLEPVIVAHLDLDAFYAAVEELENPELRSQPLDRRRRPARARASSRPRTTSRAAFGIHSAMSAAEAIRRCPHAVFVRPRHSLYREYSRHVWSTVRGVVPTVEQTGLDEGYLDLGEVAGDFLEARVVAEAVQTAVRARDEPHVLARRRAVQGRREDRRATRASPAASSSSCRGRRRRSSRRSTSAGCPASARRRRSGLRAAGVETVGALAALARRGPAPAASRQRRHACCAIARAASTRAGSSMRRRAHLDQRREHVRARPRRARAAARRAARRWRAEVAEHLQKTGQVARTVTTKLRYADFSIRSRSTSLDVGIDDAGADRRARLPPARPGPSRPARRTAPRRRRRLGPRRYRQLALDALPS